MECVIKLKNSIIRLCVVYRSTQILSKEKYDETKTSRFFEQFEEYLDTVLEKSGSPVICGDFNFHVEDSLDLVAQRFISLYKSKGFKQQVNASTHIAGGTLDLVLVPANVADDLQVTDLCIEENTGTTSDHFLLHFKIPMKNEPLCDTSTNRTFKYRQYQKIDIQSFRSDVDSLVKNAHQFVSVDEAVEFLMTGLKAILDQHAPEITVKKKKRESPWFTQRCQDARTMRRRAERLHKKHPGNAELLEAFRERKVDAAIIIDQERNRYYKDKIGDLVGNPRETYKVINHLLDKDYGAEKFPNGNCDTAVANDLKTYFKTKVDNIYAEIDAEQSTTTDGRDDLLDEQTSCHFSSFEPMSDEEILAVIMNMPNKQCSLDVVTMKLFKSCAHELIPIVSYIINQSLLTGTFPESLKKACVRPTLKKIDLDSDVLGNYRPISNLTFLSKLLEKCVYRQLLKYIEENKLFAKHQSGYRRNFSCETAITKIHNDIMMIIDKRSNVLLLMLDLSAAFDTINHKKLLKKLECLYGIKGSVLQWIESYLSNRCFLVQVRNCSSSSCDLHIGVPQGSILGPLLFILYTKDLESIVNEYNLQVHMYADDTQIYFSLDQPVDANATVMRLRSCFDSIKKWMAANFLKLNENKTEVLEIGLKENTYSDISLGNCSLKVSEKAKNLGFYFDDSMSLDSQISLVVQKCNLSLRNLRKIGSKLSKDLKIQMVHACVLSHIDYCNAVLAGITERQLHTLQKVQNQAVRFIYGLKGKECRRHITPLLQELHFLPVRQRISYKIALLSFKCLKGYAPNYLSDMIRVQSPNKSYSLRSNTDEYLLQEGPPYNYRRTRGAFSIAAPKIWNRLPYKIRSVQKLSAFKSALKTHFFDEAYT